MAGILFDLGADAVVDPDGIFPSAYRDWRMTPGTLMLIDGTHSEGALSATPGDVLPNIAWETAAAMIGSGDATTLSPTFAMDGVGTGCGKELTPNGGLHVAVRQDGAVTTGQGYSVRRPTLLEAYLAANPDHAYFAAVAINVTRAGVAPLSVVGCPIFVLADQTSSTGNFLAIMGTVPVAATNVSGRSESAGYNGAGNQYRDIGVTQATGTVDDIRPQMIQWGALSAWASALVSNPDDLLSYVLYSQVLEDLTVSGRTYAQAHADWVEWYTRATATGGGMNGDIITPAATLAGA